MKKFLTIALLCGLVGMPAFADDNEEFFIGSKAYRCGDGHGDYAFEHDSRVQVLGPSRFESTEMGVNRSYLCQAKDDFVYVGTYDDHWEPADTNWCSNSPIKQNSLVNVEYCIYNEHMQKRECASALSNGVAYRNGCIYADCMSDYTNVDGKCIKESEAECPAGSSEKVLSQQDCKSGERFECVKTGDSKQCVCGKCIAGGGEHRDDEDRTVGKCHPSVCVSEVCRECCKRPASQTVWDRTAQACQCVNGGKFQKENGAWICKVDAGAVETEQGYVCDPVLLANLAKWRTQCVNKSDVLRQILELEEYCNGKPSKEVFLRLYDETFNSVKQCTEDANVVSPVVDDDTAQKLKRSRAKITSAYNDLVGISKGFKVSVWKNKEGNFNTARLASDSIAAVVLGTTGALVTSSIVKKNQVEGGFEDIKCTIGGQTVAEWGDEFRVGIQ